MIARVWARENTLSLFVLLQLLDLLTTLIFLRAGMAEGNPIVLFARLNGHAPWIGLCAVKIFAMMIGFFCFRAERTTALRLANAGYLLIVSWNLVAIAAGALARI